MLKLYGFKNSSAFRNMWLLEELGLPYELIKLDIAKGENKTPEYLALNPMGKIPTLVDDNFVLWESLAINSYLAEKANSDMFGTSLEEKHSIEKWGLWASMHLYASLYPILSMAWTHKPEGEETKNAWEVELPRYVPVLEAALAGKEYLVGDRFTLADLNTASAANGLNTIKYDLSSYPNIQAWMGRIMARPAIQKLMAQ